MKFFQEAKKVLLTEVHPIIVIWVIGLAAIVAMWVVVL